MHKHPSWDKLTVRPRWMTALTLPAVFLSMSIQSEPALAQDAVLHCQNFHVVKNGERRDPPLQLRDSLLSLFVKEGQWTNTYIKEDNTLTRAIDQRIHGVEDGELILYRSNMGGQRVQTTLNIATLAYLDSEVGLRGQVRSLIQGTCARVQ